MGFVRDLVRWPVIQAPMGGGPGRPELAAAVNVDRIMTSYDAAVHEH